MKKCFLVLICLLVVANVYSDVLNKRFGIQTGLNQHYIHLVYVPDIFGTEDVLISTRPMKSFNFNFYYELYQIGKYGISIEPGFIQKGAIERIYSKTSEYKNMLNSFQLPVLGNIEIFDNVILSLGFEIDFLINAKYRILGDSDSRINYSYDYSRWNNYSALLGAGFRLSRTFDIGLRYSHGISSTSKNVWFSDPFGQPTGEVVMEKYRYSRFFIRVRL